MRLTAWTVVPGSITAFVALVTNYLAHWFVEIPFLYPAVRLILSPVDWLNHYFWPHQWTVYTPYRSSSTGGPPEWLWTPLYWGWLISAAFFAGAVARRVAQSAIGYSQRYFK